MIADKYIANQLQIELNMKLADQLPIGLTNNDVIIKSKQSPTHYIIFPREQSMEFKKLRTS